MTNQNVFDTLKSSLKGEHGEFAGLVGDELRVAGGKALMGLIGQKQPDTGWKWAFDDRNRRFVMVRPKTSSADRKVINTPMGPVVNMAASDNTRPPPLLSAQVQAMNQATAFLMKTNDIEDNKVLKNATADQKWRFYTRGELPPQPAAKESQSGRERISRLQNYWEGVKIDWSKVPKVDVDTETERVTGMPQGDFASRVNRAEWSGQGSDKNPNSSAKGHGQFLESTWLEVFKKHFPDEAKGKSNSEILALRQDQSWGNKMTNAYAEDNAQALGTTDESKLSLAHFLGADGARSVLNADSSTALSEILPASVLRANPFLKNWNAERLMRWARERIGG
jgi:hypothetical protein